MVAKVEARCPAELEAGKTSRYEAAVIGDQAEEADGFEVELKFD